MTWNASVFSNHILHASIQLWLLLGVLSARDDTKCEKKTKKNYKQQTYIQAILGLNKIFRLMRWWDTTTKKIKQNRISVSFFISHTVQKVKLLSNTFFESRRFWHDNLSKDPHVKTQTSLKSTMLSDFFFRKTGGHDAQVARVFGKSLRKIIRYCDNWNPLLILQNPDPAHFRTEFSISKAFITTPKASLLPFNTSTSFWTH